MRIFSPFICIKSLEFGHVFCLVAGQVNRWAKTTFFSFVIQVARQYRNIGAQGRVVKSASPLFNPFPCAFSCNGDEHFICLFEPGNDILGEDVFFAPVYGDGPGIFQQDAQWKKVEFFFDQLAYV